MSPIKKINCPFFWKDRFDYSKVKKPDYKKIVCDYFSNTGKGRHRLFSLIIIGSEWPLYLNDRNVLSLSRSTIDILTNVKAVFSKSKKVSILLKTVYSTQKIRELFSDNQKEPLKNLMITHKIIKISRNCFDLVSDIIKDFLLLQMVGIKISAVILPAASVIADTTLNSVDFLYQANVFIDSYSKINVVKKKFEKIDVIENRRLALIVIVKRLFFLISLIINSNVIYIGMASLLGIKSIYVISSIWASLYKDAMTKNLLKDFTF